MACKKSKINHKRLAADLQLLGSRFEATANALLGGANSRTAIGDARDHMTEAGRTLLKLVIGGLLPHPPVVPPWLKLSIRSGNRRPRFVGSVVRTDIGIINAIDSQGMTLSAVLRRELCQNDAVRQHKTHRASDLRIGNLRRRLVFLEAATGWLADQFQIKPRIHPPKQRLLVRSDNGNSPVDLCFDLIDEEAPQTCQFFVSVCRNGARVCSLLASKLQNAQAESAEDKQAEPSDLADVLARYNRSCEEMHTVRLNPRKAIPVNQWPEETQRRGSAIVRAHDWTRYKRYVLQVATKNEQRASQARVWWSWWEASQIEPSKAGIEPLVSPEMRAALRVAAAGRGAEFRNQARATNRMEVVSANDPARMNGKQSSAMIGVTESTLARWHSKTPAWAASNPLQFAHLMERDKNRLYKRDRVTKLGAWWSKAMQEGATRPVDCP